MSVDELRRRADFCRRSHKRARLQAAELEALCGLADAARGVLQVEDLDAAECGQCVTFSEHFAHLLDDMRAALDRLDGQDTG